MRSTARIAMVVALAVFAASLVVAAAFVIPRAMDELEERSNGATSPPIDDPTLVGVLVVADLSTEHRDDEDVDYDQVPPLGGPHDPEWLACGRYDEPVRDENAVHDLEHGTVWITHDPDLSDEDLDELEAMLPEDGIMSPYEGLPSPVVVSVWGAQLQLDGADDPRLELFLGELGNGSTAPEPFASCEGGTDDPQGSVGGLDT